MTTTADTLKRSTGPAISSTFAVVTRRETYLNALYLGLAFPLGLLYFVLLITGVALGVGLSVLVVGVPILLGVVWGSRALAAFERRLAARLLGADVPGPARVDPDTSVRTRIETVLSDAATWRGLLYLFVKFPLGVASFVLLTTAFAVTVGLVTAPLHYANPWAGVNVGWWEIDTLAEALVAVPLGVAVGVCSLHLTNLAARASGRFAQFLLSADGNR